MTANYYLEPQLLLACPPADNLGDDSKQLLAQYGEEGRSATLDGLCSTINEFRNQWLEALEILIKQQEAKAKQAERRAAKAGGGASGGKQRRAGAGPGMPAGMMGELGGALAARGAAK